jgi:hypothetical protein
MLLRLDLDYSFAVTVANVVIENVQPVVPRNGKFNHFSAVVVHCHVGLERRSYSVFGLDHGKRFIGGIDLHVDEHNFRPFSGK